MRRRIAPVVTVLVGVLFFGLVFANDLFDVGPAFEEMIDDFRPHLADEAIETYQGDIQGLAAVAEEFETSLAPALSQQLGMQPAEFQQFVGTNFPAVATGLTALPELGSKFGALINLLDEQQDNFIDADEIPTQDQPADTVPWSIFLSGIVALGLGVMMWISKKRGWAIAAVVFGLAIVVISIVLVLPAKSDSADDLNAALKPVYTAETIGEAEAGLQIVGAMGEEMQTAMLPALGQQLGQSPEELQGFLGENFPATATALQTLPDAMGRFTTLAGVFEVNLDNYDILRPVTFEPIILMFMFGGAIMALAGAWALFQKDEVAAEPASKEQEGNAATPA